MELLSGFARHGGSAEAGRWDFFFDRETRRHDDLDVALLRHDQLALYHHLRAWDLHYATPSHTLEPWDGRQLDRPIHGIWARRCAEPTAAWTCEFLLNEERDGEWVFRRNESVRRPLEEVGDRRNGVPSLCPEIVLLLLYKSSERTPKNEADFAAVRPHLSPDARAWLRAALERCDDEHPWIRQLLPPSP